MDWTSTSLTMQHHGRTGAWLRHDVIEGRRFEIPNRYRHLTRIEVRYASWDLARVHLVDERVMAEPCFAWTAPC